MIKPLRSAHRLIWWVFAPGLPVILLAGWTLREALPPEPNAAWIQVEHRGSRLHLPLPARTPAPLLEWRPDAGGEPKPMGPWDPAGVTLLPPQPGSLVIRSGVTGHQTAVHRLE